MNEQLQMMIDKGWLVPQPPNREEIEEFVTRGKDLLVDGGNTTLSTYARQDIIYAAMFCFATAALRICGCRARGEGNRARVFDALSHTVDLPGTKMGIYRNAHVLRNETEYETPVPMKAKDLEIHLKAAQELLEVYLTPKLDEFVRLDNKIKKR